MKSKIASVGVVASILCGCASVESIKFSPQTPDNGMAKGLTYFMPKKDIVVTVTVDDKKKISRVVTSTTSAYPDLENSYVLNYRENYIGNNVLNVGITDVGLLTSAKATTTSQAVEVFENLAKSAAIGRVSAASPQDAPCDSAGEYTFIFAPDNPPANKVCGLEIKVHPMWRESDDKSVGGRDRNHKSEKYNSGIYYRQSLPYLIGVTGNGVSISGVVSTPSLSETKYMPVSRTLFSNNEAELSFIDGVPTVYKQQADGEFVAFIKLPASIVGAYFSAVGGLFDGFKSNDEKEAEAMEKSFGLELAKKKFEECMGALRAKDDDRLKSLGCQ